MSFTFYDRDIYALSDDGERDIAGVDYINLIESCFQYSEILSFVIYKTNISFLKELEQYSISKPTNIPQFGRQYEFQGIPQTKQPYFQYYKLCPELKMLLYKISDSVFKFICDWGYHNPEDPIFYRSDGSVFFSSVIHEGKCTLFPREGEDVSHILSKGQWMIGPDPENIDQYY